MPEPNTEVRETPGSGDAAENKEQKVEALEAWYEGQPPETIGLINSNLGAMRNALESGKADRKKLKEQLDDILKAKNLDADAKVKQMGEQLDAANKRAAILETLPSDVIDRRVAEIAVREGDCIRRDGSVDEEKLRAAYPGLFARPSAPPGHAGTGSNMKPTPPQTGINDALRGAFGR